MSSVDAVRGLAKRQEGAPVISFYLDLDPESFATAPARASQIRSLIDEAAREVESDSSLAHDEKQGLREDLKRIGDYLRSPDAPFKGARSLAVFSSTPDGVFDAVQVPRPVQARVVIERRPYVEPLVEATDSRRWCVVLVSRREGRVLAEAVKRRYLRERFVRLAVGGPHEVVARFEGMLSDELRARLAPERVDVDLSCATDEQLRAAVSPR